MCLFDYFVGLPLKRLKIFPKNNVDKIIFAHLNINSVRNELDQQNDMIEGYIDVLMISESNLDNNFTDGKFLIEGDGVSIQINRNILGGGIMLFVRSDIADKSLSVDIDSESFFDELNFRKKKLLLNCSDNPEGSNIKLHLNDLSKSRDAIITISKSIIAIIAISLL